MGALLTRRTLLAAAAGGGALRAGATVPGHEWRPWPKGKRAPALDLTTLDGTPWRLSQQRGKVVLVNFWATWCEPCRAEMPSLARMALQRKADGLVVVAANYREGVPAIERFMSQLSIGLPVLLDRDGVAAAAWTPRIFPSTSVIDRQGRPVGVIVGEIDWESAAAQTLIEPLLAARKARL